MQRITAYSSRGSAFIVLTVAVMVACASSSSAMAAASDESIVPSFGTSAGQAFSRTQLGSDRDDQLLGSTRADRLRGAGGDDAISGGSGRDRLSGDAGDDSIAGGAGRDDLWGGSGSDSLMGGLGNDRIRGYEDDDRASGGAGADHISGGAGDDDIRGGVGNDIIDGGLGVDTLSAGDGDDVIIAIDDEMDVVSCGAGQDYVYVDAFDQVDPSCEGDAELLVQAWCEKAHAERGESLDDVRHDCITPTSSGQADGVYSDCGIDVRKIEKYIRYGVTEYFWFRRIGSVCRKISDRSDVTSWGACPGAQGSVADAQWAYGTGYVSWLCDGAAHQVAFAVGEYDLHGDWMFFGFNDLNTPRGQQAPTAGVACEHYISLEGGSSAHYRSRVLGYAYDEQWRLIAVVNHMSPEVACLDSTLT